MRLNGQRILWLAVGVFCIGGWLAWMVFLWKPLEFRGGQTLRLNSTYQSVRFSKSVVVIAQACEPFKLNRLGYVVMAYSSQETGLTCPQVYTLHQELDGQVNWDLQADSATIYLTVSDADTTITIQTGWGMNVWGTFLGIGVFLPLILLWYLAPRD